MKKGGKQEKKKEEKIKQKKFDRQTCYLKGSDSKHDASRSDVAIRRSFRTSARVALWHQSRDSRYIASWADITPREKRARTTSYNRKARLYTGGNVGSGDQSTRCFNSHRNTKSACKQAAESSPPVRVRIRAQVRVPVGVLGFRATAFSPSPRTR